MSSVHFNTCLDDGHFRLGFACSVHCSFTPMGFDSQSAIARPSIQRRAFRLAFSRCLHALSSLRCAIGRIHVQYISYLFSVFFLICIPYAFAKTTSLTIEQGVDSRSVRKASRATRTRRALFRRSLRAPLRSVFTHYFPSRLLVSRMQWTNE